tara:strand:+ start:31 stop:189 length:159 start_codon:yes stop_codon:yes gene_type:complete
MFDEKEKKLLKMLVEKELNEFTKEKSEIRPNVDFLEAEEKYGVFLKDLLEKL